jgi:hypothetical protein
MILRALSPGSAGASRAVFGAPPKTLRDVLAAFPRESPEVSREAHDTAGEAPALPSAFAAARLA